MPLMQFVLVNPGFHGRFRAQTIIASDCRVPDAD